MGEYPNSLKDISIPFWRYIDAEGDKRNKYCESGQWDFDLDRLQEAFCDIDVYKLSNTWFSQFTGSFYCGILSLDAWYNVKGNPKYQLWEEENIWEELLKYAWVNEKNSTIIFKHDLNGVLGGWLRTYSNDPEVAVNIQTLFSFAVKQIIKNDAMWTYYEEEYFEDEFEEDTELIESEEE